LINLNLAFNRISDRGVQYLASALENNTERHAFFAYFVNNRYHSKQSLSMLSVAGNIIGDEGAKHLADVLKQNKVK